MTILIKLFLRLPYIHVRPSHTHTLPGRYWPFSEHERRPPHQPQHAAIHRTKTPDQNKNSPKITRQRFWPRKNSTAGELSQITAATHVRSYACPHVRGYIFTYLRSCQLTKVAIFSLRASSFSSCSTKARTTLVWATLARPARSASWAQYATSRR